MTIHTIYNIVTCTKQGIAPSNMYLDFRVKIDEWIHGFNKSLFVVVTDISGCVLPLKV